MDRVTSVTLKQRKQSGEKIAVLTAYDYPAAKLMDDAGVDVLLVGDSCANVVMGLPDTLGITMDQMVHHTRMVSRAATRAMVVGDMPFLSYQISPEEALRHAGRFVQEGGAQAVKLEGSADKFGSAIASVIRAGIPVMGHLGLTPQSVNVFGGYKVQGRDPQDRVRIKDEALGLEAAGCFSIVLECIPADLAEEITAAVSIPTIGIGAGAACDGQVLVMHDMLGFGAPPKFVKRYADIAGTMRRAFEEYVKDVKTGAFPGKEHQY
ncbi:MAG TPA: 3-methyl-2-oxobutanoate hydroxymethyltransferase [Candidatus Hydrogenedentes bacterium]|nr:3-methyl-2-oxobutanoate hydroxymethyltransferase [Candidatus Hydrogenedentota bacterium]HOS03090.1 3-methyl-2-oxobutanoate hydroxymethyltransferase [Candidatus Hydrogenedentota bacterium]